MMTKLVVLVLSLFLIPGISHAKGYELKQSVGGYAAEIRIDRNPVILGDNNIEIEIKDGAGRSVTDAKVLVNYYMPPMPRMVPMNFTTGAKLKGDRYRAIMNVIMTGPWIVAVKITHGGKTSTAKFNVDAH